MIRTVVITKDTKPTGKQLEEIRKAKERPITYDKDCEKLSPAMEKAFKCAASQRNRSRQHS